MVPHDWHHFRIHVITFNMAGTLPASLPSDFSSGGGQSQATQPPDM